MDPSPFNDPWEHARLLSDARRNRILVELLQRHAPGRRVLEVGCGTGLLSMIAARLGASHVFAVEPTDLVDVAREMIEDNGLCDRITVLQGMIEDLEPQPVDLAFSELLNADPFVEGIVSAMRSAAAWVTPGGLLAPHRLRIYAAPVQGIEASDEVQRARAQVAMMARRYQLDLNLLDEVLNADETCAHLTGTIVPSGEPVLALDVPLGRDSEVPDDVEITLNATGWVEGIAVWFEAQLDDQLVLHNGPGQPGHWGHQTFLLAEALDCGDGQELTLSIETDGDGPIDVRVI